MWCRQSGVWCVYWAVKCAAPRPVNTATREPSGGVCELCAALEYGNSLSAAALSTQIQGYLKTRTLMIYLSRLHGTQSILYVYTFLFYIFNIFDISNFLFEILHLKKIISASSSFSLHTKSICNKLISWIIV